MMLCMRDFMTLSENLSNQIHNSENTFLKRNDNLIKKFFSYKGCKIYFKGLKKYKFIKT